MRCLKKNFYSGARKNDSPSRLTLLFVCVLCFPPLLRKTLKIMRILHAVL